GLVPRHAIQHRVRGHPLQRRAVADARDARRRPRRARVLAERSDLAQLGAPPLTEPARPLRAVSEPTDRIALLRAGDPVAVREAVRELLPDVRKRLSRLLGNRSDLDDATQETLSEIARFLPRFEGRAKLDTVAYRITLRVAYRYFKPARETSLEV